MRVVRIDTASGPTFGRLEDDVVHHLTAAPWEGGVPTGATVSLADTTLLAPATPSKIVGIGRNYRDHIEEMGYQVPERPSIFLKPPSALIGPGAAIELPPPGLAGEVQHEAELVAVIGRRMRNVAADSTLEHVFGFTGGNDVSARVQQRQDGNQTRAKGFDTFCPIGPWIETDLDLASGVAVRCDVNGERRQDGNTAQLVFDVAGLLSTLSHIMTLEPGDLVMTGTPGGCTDLAPGDTVRVEIGGIGRLENPVVAT